MALTRKEVAAAALTALAVLVFLATHEGWGVPLVGDSHRWAAGAIFLLGSLTCGLGSPGKDAATKLLAILGAAALVLAVLAVATGSLAPLSPGVAGGGPPLTRATLRPAASAPPGPGLRAVARTRGRLP